MDGFHDKKWFVYLGDHHEGPFSLAEIEPKMAEGRVTSSSYVWSEGMADWQVMTEVPAFDRLLYAKKPLETPPAPEAVTILAAAESTAAGTPAAAAPATAEAEKVPQIVTKAKPKTNSSDIEEFKKADVILAKAEAKERRKGNFKKVVPVLVAAGVVAAALSFVLLKSGERDGAEALVLALVEKVPALGKWVSPLPKLADVSPEESQELKSAAIAAFDPAAPVVAAAISRADLFLPVFYVSANVPDGTVFDVYIEGIPDTLLNRLSFSAKAQAIIMKRLGRSNAIKVDGKPIPRGEYNVFFTEGESQPEAAARIFDSIQADPGRLPANLPSNFPKGHKVVVAKSYFLGGSKDASYTQQLKEFQDRIRTQALKDIADVHQFVATLESQLKSTQDKFAELKKMRVLAKKKRSWEEFHGKWNGFQAGLHSEFQNWTPDRIEKEFFYGVLYQLTQQAGQSIERLHEAQQAYFTTQMDPKSAEIQLGEAASLAQASINALKTKLEQAEKIPPTPKGLPQKEGL